MFRGLIALLVLAGLTMGAGAATVIDDFDVGPMHNPLTDPDDTLAVAVSSTDTNAQTGLDTAHVIGGSRTSTLIGGGAQGSANAQIYTDLRFNNDTDYDSTLVLTWDNSLDVDLTGESEFFFKAKTDAGDHKMNIQLVLTDGTAKTATGTADVQGTAWDYVNMPFAGMTVDAGFDWGHVSKFELALTPDLPGNDANFDFFAAGNPDDVPEPFTMALMGLGVAGLGGYIRRRR